MWGAVSNLLFGDVCRAPPPHELEAAEVVVGPQAGYASGHADDEEPVARPPPPPQSEGQQQQVTDAADAMHGVSQHDEASVAVPSSAPVAAKEAVQQNIDEEPETVVLPSPPLLEREMTDLIDLKDEPKAADPFDLSTVDFATTEPSKKAPLDDRAAHVETAALVGGA